MALLLGRTGDACLARLGGLLAARRRGGVAARAAHRREMSEETAGTDARIVGHALDDADQHVALAVELRDRAAAIAHAGAGADRAVAIRIDEPAVARVGHKARLFQARRVHALGLARGAVARDGVGAAGAGVAAGRDRNEVRGQGAREGQQRGLAGGRVARDRDARAARDHVERPVAFDAMIRGQELLAADHCRGAQQVMADEFHHMPADGTGALAAHHSLRVAWGKKKGG